MRRFPYPTDPTTGFDAIEADAMFLERLAEEVEGSVAALKQIGARPEAIMGLESRAQRLRRVAACLGYMAGRLDRLNLLNEPVRRESNYGGQNQSRSAA